MIRHIFLWRVAQAADPAEVLGLLNELPGNVPGIQSWGIGKFRDDLGHLPGAWDYGLSCEFDSIADLKTYFEHPFHQKIIEQLAPMVADRAVCHFEVVQTAS